MLVWSPTNTFGTPAAGTAYSAGQNISGGGTVLYRGSNTNFSHTGLSQLTTYYYRAYTYDGANNYSAAVSSSATTHAAPITAFPRTETFEDNSPTRSAWTLQQVSGSELGSVATGSNGGNIISAYQGSRNASFTGSPGGPYITKMISPVLNLSGLDNPELSFWYGQQTRAGDQNELKVYYRTSTALV